MPLDSYSSCPCGSGKKFKWCCQPIQAQIFRAIEQDEQGQHEAALRLMDQVVAEHPNNPQAWGRKAELLYKNDRVEEAENALQKAFACNPNYPFGYLLRGEFRLHEGEVPGALLLYRKAADLYDLDAREVLAQVYARIADCESKLNHPVAARAAMQQLGRLLPGDVELRQNMEQLFGKESPLPEAARREYAFQGPAALGPQCGGNRRAAWDRALGSVAGARLSEAAHAFEQLTGEDAEDAAAWYNLGLARAWLGDNAGAVEALDRYVALEADEARAAAAWTLAEVLRCGHGMEDQADYHEYSATFLIRNPEAVVSLIEEWRRDQRLIGIQADQERGFITAVVIDKAPVLTAGTSGGQMVPLGCYLLLAGDLLRLWFPRKESLDRLRAEVQFRIGPVLSEPREHVDRVTFGDVVVEAAAIPVGRMDPAEVERRLHEHAAQYFEETWIHRPLRSLNLIPPVDAAGHGTLRKKLLGLVQFLQDCAGGGSLQVYDFDRLRRKLGLLGAVPAASAAPGPTTLDIAALGAAELSGLAADTLTDQQLEQAYQTAQKLDALELAGKFVRQLVARPPRPEYTDRYRWYAFLVQQAVAEGNTDQALDFVNEGEHFDCEHNEGRRRNDYEFRRGQVHVKRREADSANDVYERLLERAPSDLGYAGSAAEGMLALRQGARALRFAEKGLAAARQQNNRDSEQYFLELVAAARKQAV